MVPPLCTNLRTTVKPDMHSLQHVNYKRHGPQMYTKLNQTGVAYINEVQHYQLDNTVA